MEPSDKRSDYLESLFCRRDSSHTAAPSIYSRGSPGIGCYTPTSRPTCVRVNDAPPTLKYAPRWTKIRGRFSIGRADSLVTASYSSSFLCNLEKLPFLVLFKSSSSFFLNFEDHFLVLPIFFRSEIFRSEEIFEKFSRSSNIFFSQI